MGTFVSSSSRGAEGTNAAGTTVGACSWVRLAVEGGSASVRVSVTVKDPSLLAKMVRVSLEPSPYTVSTTCVSPGARTG